MEAVTYDDILFAKRAFVEANGLRFLPVSEEKPDQLDITLMDRVGITGQTRFNRYPTLFSEAVICLQSTRPDRPKRILSAPSSIGAEATSLAVYINNMGLLNEYQIDCVDIRKEYIHHARTRQFPANMFLKSSARFRSAFKFASNPVNDQTRWLEPVKEITDAIKIHSPADVREFEAKEKYDIIFIMTIMMHLTASQQTQVLENMLAQSRGLVCFDPAVSICGDESVDETSARLNSIVSNAGFVWADTVDVPIKPSRYVVRRPLWIYDEAYIAIHPDLAAEISQVCPPKQTAGLFASISGPTS